jgi:hypothetical protein
MALRMNGFKSTQQYDSRLKIDKQKHHPNHEFVTIYELQTESLKSTHPLLYGVAKTHKKRDKMRPITSYLDSP